MAASRFVNFSDEDISQFLEENENKSTARKTSQDIALFKTFLRERNCTYLHSYTIIKFNFLVLQLSSLIFLSMQSVINKLLHAKRQIVFLYSLEDSLVRDMVLKSRE